MNSQTFREYTEQRISDWNILSDYLPTINLIDINNLRAPYQYEDHLNETKKALEVLFKRELSWTQVDGYSNTICKYIMQNIEPFTHARPTTIDEAIEMQVLLRRKFCDMIGIDFPQEHLELYKQSCLHTITNRANSTI